MRRLAISLSVAILVAVGLAASVGGDAAARLHALFEREWEWRLEQNPLLATDVGRHEYNDRLPSAAPEARERRVEATRGFLEELAAIDRAELSDQDRVSYDMFRRQLEDRVAEYEFGDWQIPINADSGFHIGFARLPEEVPLATPEDYENYLARLRELPRYFGEQVANMRIGLERGMTLPRVVLDGYETTISSHVVDDATESVFWAPFESFPVGVPAGERDRLRAAGREAIGTAVVPAYRSFHRFFVDEYVPGARETLGASELPGGDEYYAYLVRHFTTLDVTPREVHDTGLREVERIRAEMDAVIEEAGFEGTFDEFLEFLRTDPRFYPETGEELLKQAAWIAKRMDGELPSLFKTLPRLPYGVEPVPDHMAPKYTAGRYVGAPKGSTQAGTYWVNTYDLPSRTLYTLEALTLHEAVPGHHLQNALAQELEELPDFRQYNYISAFGEGWGLYSERLGLEAGFYTDPYSNFGRLTYEMWRACRLVVDTGLHAMGWTRQQAMDYLAERTALSLHEVRTETDRYISWPGQALAYKMGEHKIRELRARAEEALGEAFDVREFHDTVLLHGSVPLPVLEENVERWIAAEKDGG
ncbi:MAG TPA: DUF885 domain-containing protein [Thermoanaerobaculia bacterium]